MNIRGSCGYSLGIFIRNQNEDRITEITKGAGGLGAARPAVALAEGLRADDATEVRVQQREHHVGAGGRGVRVRGKAGGPGNSSECAPGFFSAGSMGCIAKKKVGWGTKKNAAGTGFRGDHKTGRGSSGNSLL